MLDATENPRLARTIPAPTMPQMPVSRLDALQPSAAKPETPPDFRSSVKPLVLPTIVLQILKITQEDRDDAGTRLEKLISQDPGFSARLLTSANSPVFATGAPVTNIKQAIMVVGIKGIRTLALAVSAADIFQCSSSEDLIRARMWWRLSCDSAVCAKWLARERKLRGGDEAYLAALLHCVGKMQIIKAAQDQYKKVENLLALGWEVLPAERETFGTDHIELGIESVTTWGLPNTLVAALNYRTAPAMGDPDAGARAATAIGIAIGNPEGRDGRPVLPEWALEILGIAPYEEDGLIEDGRTALAAASRVV